MSSPFLDEEAMRLLTAFVQVKDPEARRLILALVEAASRGGTIKAYHVEGETVPKTH